MVRVAMQPGFEIVGRLLGELSAFFGGAIDEGGRGDRLRGAGRGRWWRGHSRRGRRLGRGKGRRRRIIGRVAGRQDELLIGKGPLFGLGGTRRVGPSILLARDAARVREHLLLADGRAERRVAEAVFVLQLDMGAAGRRAGPGDRGRGVGPLVGLDVGGLLAQIRGERGGEGRHLGRGGGYAREGIRGGFWVIIVVVGIGEVVCGWVGVSAGGLRVRGRPVAGVRCGVGGEGGATDEGVLEGGKDGGELDLLGVGVELPVGVVDGAVVWLRRGGGRGVLFGEDAARVSVGHSSWREVGG